MINTSFLWVDLQHQASSVSLFETLPDKYQGHKLYHPNDIHTYIAEEKPQFLCFEFDSPRSQDLELLQKTKQLHPELPILMITNPHTEALAVWAFRSGVRDYLVKPCAHQYLNASIDALCELCQQRCEKQGRKSLLPPCPLTEDVLNRPSINNHLKTAPAIHFVQQHLTEEIRLSIVSELCCLSESVFSRTFKKEHNINFSEYVMKKRINKACELLQIPSTQIKAVAFSVGFNDLSYFTRIFRRYLGVTPSDFQRMQKTSDYLVH